MKIIKQFSKQPNDIQDYQIDFSKWLLAVGDTILSAASSFTCITDAALTDLELTATQIVDEAVWVMTSGGTHGNVYKITVTADTVSGRRKEADILLRVIEV